MIALLTFDRKNRRLTARLQCFEFRKRLALQFRIDIFDLFFFIFFIFGLNLRKGLLTECKQAMVEAALELDARVSELEGFQIANLNALSLNVNQTKKEH